MTNWEELYTDLTTRTARALRQARVKPDKLTTMGDGEITAIAGIGDKALQEIREKYPVTATEKPAVKEKKPKSSTESTSKDEKKEQKPAKSSRAQLPPNKRHLFRASKRFVAARNMVEKGKLYSTQEAVALLKKVNVARFNATVTLHLVTLERVARVEVGFPHQTGKKRVVEVASAETLEKLEAGKIDFDILVTSPDMMPRLARFAKLLGPKGLMPNPKLGTISPDPEKKKKELEGGKTLVQSEVKSPLMHVTVGKIEMKEDELRDNIQAVIDAVKPKNIARATLASSMSPGIKLLIQTV